MSAGPIRLEDLEEGSDCPTGCGGTLEAVRGPDCSCHISPPCSSCVEDYVECDDCGWRLPDGLPDGLPEGDEAAPGGAS